jgi:hypothetical protein
MQTETEIEEPKKSGTYVEFTEEIFAEICERMAEGQGLRKICSDAEMPSRSTFLRWVENDTDQRAREALMDWYAEEILDIAFDDKGDIISDGGKVLGNHAAVQRARLKVDTLKWTMSKLHPKRYGDKLTHEAETQAEALKISWDDRPHRIIRQIITGPIFDDDGKPISGEETLRARIAELEERLGMREPAPGPPRLLEYDPGPLPSRMDGEIVLKLVSVIKANVPQADQRDPESVLDEVLHECAKALQAKYGASEAA